MGFSQICATRITADHVWHQSSTHARATYVCPHPFLSLRFNEIFFQRQSKICIICNSRRSWRLYESALVLYASKSQICDVNKHLSIWYDLYPFFIISVTAQATLLRFSIRGFKVSLIFRLFIAKPLPNIWNAPFFQKFHHIPPDESLVRVIHNKLTLGDTEN